MDTMAKSIDGTISNVREKVTTNMRLCQCAHPCWYQLSISATTTSIVRFAQVFCPAAPIFVRSLLSFRSRRMYRAASSELPGSNRNPSIS